jgi:hypothetical protein
MKFLVIISVHFEVTDQPEIIPFAFIRYWKKWKYNERVYQLFVDFRKGYDSVGREVVYNILIEFELSMKL